MPILIILALALIIAQVGFWNTLEGIFGALAVIVLFVLLVGLLIGLAARVVYARARRRF